MPSRHKRVRQPTVRPGAAQVYRQDAAPGLADTVRFDWDALDAWYEEEQVFVHPRNPYVRVDALRSSRTVRVQLDGVVLAETASPVFVFEPVLPTRYYKGRTSGYWSVRTGDTTHTDLAWSYDFPTRQLLPITGMLAFYNEKLDHVVDGQLLERRVTTSSGDGAQPATCSRW